ncbi:FG-GAP repeat domain-containing protein [Flavitalea antarctica]
MRKKTVIIVVTILAITVLVIFLNFRHNPDPDSRPVNNDSINNQNISARDSSQRTAPKIDFLTVVNVGQPFADTPQVSHVYVSDFDLDQLADIIVCDTRHNSVSWIRQYPRGQYKEFLIADSLVAPAHAQVVDIDKDGDQDIVVAVLGALYPNNAKIGSVVILESRGGITFQKHVIAGNIARVSDVRAGDLDGDGDLDLAVAQFGYNDGETQWMENLGHWKFKGHSLQQLSGPINVIISDIDRDGDLDILSLVSQEWEEIYCYLNDGAGIFSTKILWGSSNEDFGSSSIFLSDLDKDGDEDIIYTNGDSFNYTEPAERPWHGIQWLENKGDLQFELHRICNFVGAYNCRPADIDNDGDIDLVAVSAFNIWKKPEAQSMIWLENDGMMNFTKRDIASNPTHLITLEICDLNKDGLMDLVTGGLYIYPPYDRLSRVCVWTNNGKLQP